MPPRNPPKSRPGTPQVDVKEHHGFAWWQQSRAERPLAFVPKGPKGTKKVPISDEELRKGAPCEVVRDVLPKQLANELLALMLADVPTWQRGQWIMFGKTHDAPRTSCYYSLACGKADAEESSDYKDVSAMVDRRNAPGALREAAHLIDRVVRRLAERAERDLAPRDRNCNGGWAASYALANHYADGQEAVGAHADRLTPLGKRPIIASLSLGATRTFRLRRAAAGDAAEGTSVGGAGTSGFEKSGGGEGADINKAEPATTSSPAGGKIDSVDVSLEHNTLVIMWPPTQEEWRHEVPRSKAVGRHPVSGTARINLTFRRLDPASAARAPLCRCGNQAVLKASLNRRPPAGNNAGIRDGQHAYYFACDNTKGSCGFWRWDDA
ncbi:probable DNA oxidative demethylase ALKBH2 [Coccomyxa sp. Obi]|nr:probable DNA oxidative demethylase ALKBH2 [Coccomyxa sp. Obi]